MEGATAAAGAAVLPGTAAPPQAGDGGATAAHEIRLESLSSALPAEEKVVITQSGPAGPPIPKEGISLDGILAVVEDCGGRAALAGLSTSAFVERFVKPRTTEHRTSYAVAFGLHCTGSAEFPQAQASSGPHLMPSGAIGHATVFVSHAWATPFLELVAALEDWVARQAASPEQQAAAAGAGGAASEPQQRPAGVSPASSASTPTYFWLDVFVNNQHGTSDRPFEWWQTTFRDNIKELGRTLLVLEYAAPRPLTRAWCLWEIVSTVTSGATLEIVMSNHQREAFERELLEDFDAIVTRTCNVDLATAKAFHAADAARIHAAAAASPGGILALNQLVLGQVREWMVGCGQAAIARARIQAAAMQADASISTPGHRQVPTAGAEATATDGTAAVSTARLPAPLVALARMLAVTGQLLFDHGQLPQAEQLAEEALELRRSALGNDHPDTLRALRLLGLAKHAQGKMTDAEPLLQEAVAASRRALGDDHEETLNSLSYLGRLRKDQGNYEEATTLTQEALAISRAKFGEDHPKSLASLNLLGILLHMQGKLADAETHYRQVLSVRQRVLGSEHPETITSMSNLGELLQACGKHPDAEQLHREALAVRRRTLGDEHFETAMSCNNLGRALKDQGKLEEAEPLLHQALAARRHLHGDEHPMTFVSISNLGGLLQAQGKLEEAEPLQRELLATSRRVLGAEHPHTLVYASSFGQLLTELGKLDEAEPLLQDVLAARRRLSGDANPGTLVALRHVGTLLIAQGKQKDAEPLLRAAVETSRSALGDTHPTTLSLQATLARC